MNFYHITTIILLVMHTVLAFSALPALYRILRNRAGQLDFVRVAVGILITVSTLQAWIVVELFPVLSVSNEVASIGNLVRMLAITFLAHTLYLRASRS